MSRTLSIFLDALRFLAAIVVGHFTEGTFTSGWPDRTRVAVQAVAVFFVLSGFVISFVVDTKEKNLLDYSVARISRLYSVLVPAILLSGLVLLLVNRFDSVYMSHCNSQKTNLGFLYHHPTIRFFSQSVLSLTFLNSIHDHDAYPAMNSPIWSLGYEAAYYAFFAVVQFTRGHRRILFLLVSCLLFGTGIIRLFPLWIAGVALHRFSSKYKIPPDRTIPIGLACLATCVVGVLVWPLVDLWGSSPHSRILDLLLHGQDRAADAYLYYYWGVLTCLLVLAALALENQFSRILLPLEKPIRWLAAHTFSLYLFHFPLLVLIYVTTHYDRSSVLAKVIVFLTVFTLCILLSSVTESKKYWWRKAIRGVFVRNHA